MFIVGVGNGCWLKDGVWENRAAGAVATCASGYVTSEIPGESGLGGRGGD